MDKDPMDVEAVVDGLQRVLPLQLRSATAYTLAAASIVGFSYAALSQQLWTFATLELEDARRLGEKIVTLGGRLCDDVPGFAVADDPEDTIKRLIELETEAIEALQDVIPATGQEGRSEALEHRLEHVIMRKQEQVDTLVRASRQP
ncbi:MAG TPA: ferritin-like domain-containing protein [Capillimicrobium sp.]|nr:ferritin-like domain-containing protein [Capillimicrobium sp.]